MSTSTAPAHSKTQARTSAAAKARAQRALPHRALLVQLGTVDAARERLADAAKSLNPTKARKRASSLQARVTDTLSSFERRGERTNTDLQRQIKRARTQVERRLRRGPAKAGA